MSQLYKRLFSFHGCPDEVYEDAKRILDAKPIPESETQFVKQVKDSIDQALRQPD